MRKILSTILTLVLIVSLTSCGLINEMAGGGEVTENADGSKTFSTLGADVTLSIISGSENEELEHLFQDFVDENRININISYKGSLDIMNMLQSGNISYDAVWPANSMWISMGDDHHLVKHIKSTSITPIVLGIRQSKADELGYSNEVNVMDLINDINEGNLRFTMTSASQSNSGASAYIGFISALAGNPSVITQEDLENPELVENLTSLLSGVERSSGSSNWLKDLYLTGNYDAMINYEALVISANNELAESSRETMQVVYLKDGTVLADSPLGYVDKKDPEIEDAFLKFQDYLMSDHIQDEIQKTGRRTGFQGIKDSNRDVFKSEWGIDVDRNLSQITMPSKEVTMEALNLYQTEFRKPSLTIYVLDMSGSMSGQGVMQLKNAMHLILDQEEASRYLLQANSREKNYTLLFSSDIDEEFSAGGDSASLREMDNNIQSAQTGGGTMMYLALNRALEILNEEDLKNYSPAIILLTDGEAYEADKEEFFNNYSRYGGDVPIFSIMFGSADETQLKELADLSNARVFDGREDLVEAFKSVKGYN